MTLLELMTVVAILGVVAAMGVSAMGDTVARGATQNASAELSAALNMAKNRAAERGSSVIVLVYPTYRKATGTLTGGNGAYFIYEDADGDFFVEGTTPANGDRSYASFTPPSAIRPTGTSPDRLLEAVYLDDYAKGNARFFKPQTGFTTITWAAPFTNIATAANANGCSFCAGTKGAMAFSADRNVRFFKADGSQSSAQVQGLAIQAPLELSTVHRFGVVAATGFSSYSRVP
jgi:prepilin-type N-terminal cleavage/methylation domain-containing protein